MASKARFFNSTDHSGLQENNRTDWPWVPPFLRMLMSTVLLCRVLGGFIPKPLALRLSKAINKNIPFTACFLCVSHFAKGLLSYSFNPQSCKSGAFIRYMHKWANWGSERLRNSSKLSQLARGKAEFWILISLSHASKLSGESNSQSPLKWEPKLSEAGYVC